MKYNKKHLTDSYLEKLLRDIKTEQINRENESLIKKRKWYQFIFCC